MKKVVTMEKQFLVDSTRKGQKSHAQNALKLQQQKAIIARKQSKALSVAFAPGKSLMMNAFMLYMSGKTLSLWSMSSTGMAIMNPIRSILTIHSTFAPLEDRDGKVDLQMPKLLFILLNLIWLCIGVYKMSSMRLLPTTSADWSGRIVWKEMMEISSIPPE
eukprot:CAMPEP_0184857620 /NCGR_PEP_ID=MMETSP0580-20130426/2772_1 /TAXON_ID=1118495 /ORGANISM="Dactyliosolen fragilissimus" /LENGTH=160 /DNA_ID=CAMNT_0027353323 /DNA_START=195 /DNA_END=677 /DNA_ORIENTATION=-